MFIYYTLSVPLSNYGKEGLKMFSFGGYQRKAGHFFKFC